MRKFIAGLAAALIVSSGPIGCGRVAEGVLTAAPAFLIDQRQEIALGLEAAREIVQQTPVYRDPALASYVQRLGARIAGSTERADLPWTFTVLDAAEPDAFALPGGFIFITTGMIRRMNDEAELAGVLAHEVGHVAARHSLELVREAALAQGVQAAVLGSQGSAATQLVADVLTGLVLRGYGRQKELEADSLGARYATALGWDASALGDMLTRLEREGGSTPGWLAPLSTHPSLTERLSVLENTMAGLGGGGAGGTRGTRGDAGAFAAATASLR